MNRIMPNEIRKALINVYDVQYRELDCRFGKVYIIFILSICDSKRISETIIRPLLHYESRSFNLESIMNRVIQTDNIRQLEDADCAVRAILNGSVVIVFAETGEAVNCRLKGYETRAVDIPQSETVIKGPREGFTEDLSTNISELRRRIKTPSLKLERYYLGSETRTELVLIYIEGCTPQKLINYARDKIKQLENDKTKYIFYSNALENALKCKHTPFDTIGFTEKPDVAASKLSEGRVLIIMDGNPFVITAPTFFIENFQTPDDYTLNPIMANLGRVFRWTAFFMSTFIPGMYLALVTYHFKLVPNIFLYRLALFRAGVPVPTVIELLYMIFFFQIIREAGVRLPQPIGPTLSIVGALILGEASVNSGLSSQITVVIVAITSIASYLIPILHAAIFTFGVGTVLLSAFIGLPGFYMGFVLFVAHLAGLTSCGYPYLYPFGTGNTFKHNDIFIRGDLTKSTDEPLARN